MEPFVSDQKTMISVIIPFYNRIDYLLDAIKSVKRQTFKNYEIILINDGSTDCLEELMKVINCDAKITYLYQENKGPAAARNYGISKAQGEYIAFLDSDDMYVEEKLQIQFDYMHRNNLSISHTAYDHITLDGHFMRTLLFEQMEGDIFSRSLYNCAIATPTIMAKRVIFEEYKFIENLQIGEDICLWIDIAFRYNFGFIPQALTKVRVGPETASKNRHKQLLGLHNIIGYIIGNPRYSGFDEELYKLIQTFLIEATPLSTNESSIEEKLICSEQEKIMLRSEIDILKAEVAAYQNSTSWRITKPLRALKDSFRKG